MYVDANYWKIEYDKPLHIYLFRYKHKIREIQRSLVLANVGFIEIDEDGVILDANEAILELLDLGGIYGDANELINKKIENIVGPGYGEECVFKVKDVFGKDRSIAMECNIKTIRGGDEKIFNINAIPDYNLEFKKDVVKIIATDLTDLKNTEKKLENKSKMYQTLISVAPIGIALIDSTGKFTECNTYLTMIMGAPSADDFIGKTIYDFASMQEVGLVSEIRSVLEKGEPAIGEKEYVSQYGKKVHLSYAFVPVKENGKFSAFGILEDRSRTTR
jgi:PAS domain S-box-containing protein